PEFQLATSAAVVFGVQRLVPTFDPTWYKSLKKPTWTPPNVGVWQQVFKQHVPLLGLRYVFPLVWIPLKAMQSLALMLAWRGGTMTGSSAKHPALAVALTTFGAHLFLGNWWNVVFFGRRKLLPSLPWMYAFWGSVAASAAAFHPLDPRAATLMLPTLVWVTIAAKLNYDIVQLNRPNRILQYNPAVMPGISGTAPGLLPTNTYQHVQRRKTCVAASRRSGLLTLPAALLASSMLMPRRYASGEVKPIELTEALPPAEMYARYTYQEPADITRYITDRAAPGDSQAVLQAIDEFATAFPMYRHVNMPGSSKSGTWLGPEKGAVLEAAVALARPQLVVELGSFVHGKLSTMGATAWIWGLQPSAGPAPLSLTRASI
ncbi:hypothetical protein QJQ45_027543, partial [Haematococcus lacustris]